ncbi:hypothetical protein A3Q56_04794 [Intoshia linei]|uniref:snRNA-activating protein complex subunit 3 n=1 Tax=Intoshia linei TaxID=1819745 RepID=A0A177B220_9BILA|nr:hypothetical protein A3Q56_04794 [Intoshia linei]
MKNLDIDQIKKVWIENLIKLPSSVHDGFTVFFKTMMNENVQFNLNEDIVHKENLKHLPSSKMTDQELIKYCQSMESLTRLIDENHEKSIFSKCDSIFFFDNNFSNIVCDPCLSKNQMICNFKTTIQVPEKKNYIDRIDNLIYTIVLYSPFMHGLCKKISQIIDVHSDNLISDVVDNFFCFYDGINDKNIINNTIDEIQDAIPNTSKPSILFMGEYTFVDTRSRKEQDEYLDVINFIKLNKENYDGNYLSMESTKMSDLNFKMGKFYSYYHQCTCEHPFVIKSVRIANQHDSVKPENYPNITYFYSIKRNKCQICREKSIQIILKNHSLLPITLCYCCCDCFQDLKNCSKTKMSAFQCWDECSYTDSVKKTIYSFSNL